MRWRRFTRKVTNVAVMMWAKNFLLLLAALFLHFDGHHYNALSKKEGEIGGEEKEGEVEMGSSDDSVVETENESPDSDCWEDSDFDEERLRHALLALLANVMPAVNLKCCGLVVSVREASALNFFSTAELIWLSYIKVRPA